MAKRCGVKRSDGRATFGRFCDLSGILFALFVVAWGTARLGAKEPRPSGGDVPGRADLERQFSEALTGATFVGHFTANDKADGTELTKERYTLGTVKKLASGKWLFEARIQYGEHDVTLPLTLPVEWAGSTPVITVDDLPVPGLGDFTARVLVYDDHYAGFWRGKDHGGHLFGVIKQAPSKGPSKPLDSRAE